MEAQPEILESDFRHPPLRLGAADVARRLAALGQAAWTSPLRNPHHEARVSEAVSRAAEPAAVLIPIVERAAGAQVVLTRRSAHITYGGHICFPGGRPDPGDVDASSTALRETEEEIGLAPGAVSIVGRLGDYTTQRGVRITPFVGLVDAGARMVAEPSEVDEILEVPLERVLDSTSYQLVRRPDGQSPEGVEGHRGLFVFAIPGTANRSLRLADLGEGSAYVTGPTVALMMGFYESLLRAEGDSA